MLLNADSEIAVTAPVVDRWPDRLQTHEGREPIISATHVRDLSIGLVFPPEDPALNRLHGFSGITVHPDKELVISIPHRGARYTRNEKIFEERIAAGFQPDGTVDLITLRGPVNSVNPEAFQKFATEVLRNEEKVSSRCLAFLDTVNDSGGRLKLRSIEENQPSDRWARSSVDSLGNRENQLRPYHLSPDERREFVRIALDETRVVGRFEGNEVQQGSLFDVVIPGKAGLAFDNWLTAYDRKDVKDLTVLVVPHEFRERNQSPIVVGVDLPRTGPEDGLNYHRLELIYAIALANFGEDALIKTKSELELGFTPHDSQRVLEDAQQLAEHLSGVHTLRSNGTGWRERAFNKLFKDRSARWEF